MAAAGRRAAARSVRPRLAVSWVVVLLTLTLVLRHWWALAVLLAALVCAARVLGAAGTMGRVLRTGMVFGAALFVVQVMIDRNGLTVLARLGDAGPFGELDITLEGVVGAGTQALRLLSGMAVTALSLELVDVDGVLESVRRRAPRLGVTATLALRLAPVIAADGRRYADGLRCRAGGQLTARDRVQVAGALMARTLDRASDASGILELRGLGRPLRSTVAQPRRRWSRAEQLTAAAATAATAVLVAGVAAGA